jgi:hypothetical protein
LRVETMMPVITDLGMREVTISFMTPVPASEYTNVLRKIIAALEDSQKSNELNARLTSQAHSHSFRDTPLFDAGEEIAILRECPCGLTLRETV